MRASMHLNENTTYEIMHTTHFTTFSIGDSNEGGEIELFIPSLSILEDLMAELQSLRVDMKAGNKTE